MASPTKDMKTGAYAHPFEGGVGGYKQFEMKAKNHNNSPMDKNFGINGNKSEMSIKTKAPLESSPAKGFLDGIMGGAWGKIKAKMEAKKNAAAAAVSGAGDESPEEEQEAAQGAIAANPGRGFEGSEGGEGGGEVPMHGMESHNKGKRQGGGFFGKVKSMMGGGGAQAGGALGNLFSDIRLKEKIEKTGVSASGIPIYEFNYIGGSNRYSGAMAQDLLEINPNAVTMDVSGYYLKSIGVKKRKLLMKPSRMKEVVVTLRQLMRLRVLVPLILLLKKQMRVTKLMLLYLKQIERNKMIRI